MMLFVLLVTLLIGANAQNSINMGLHEVTASATLQSGTNSIITPGALAIAVNPPGTLKLKVTATGSAEWQGQPPKFDVYIFTDAQWTQYKGPNVGSVGTFSVLKQNVGSVDIDQGLPVPSQGPGKYWVLLYNQAGVGANPPAFSTITFNWQVSFSTSSGPLAGTPGAPRCLEAPFDGTPTNLKGPFNAQGLCTGVCTYNCKAAVCTLTVTNNGANDNLGCSGAAAPTPAVPCQSQALCDSSPLITCAPGLPAFCQCNSQGQVTRKQCGNNPSPTPPISQQIPCQPAAQPACNAMAAARGGCPPGSTPTCTCTAAAPSTPVVLTCLQGAAPTPANVAPTPAPTPSAVNTACPQGFPTACPITSQATCTAQAKCAFGMIASCGCCSTNPAVVTVANCMPSGAAPTPVVVQPTPAGVQPTPAGVQPTPAGVQPTPAVVFPTPAGVFPTPAGVQPTPAGVQPTPAGPPPQNGNIVCPAGAMLKCQQSTLMTCQPGQTATCHCTPDGFSVVAKFCSGGGAQSPPVVGDDSCPPALQEQCEASLTCENGVECKCSGNSITSAQCPASSITLNMSIVLLATLGIVILINKH